MALNIENIVAELEQATILELNDLVKACLLYTSPSPRDTR